MPAVMFRGHVGGGLQEEANGQTLNGLIFSPVTWDLP